MISNFNQLREERRDVRAAALATVVIGGIISSTFLTLVLLPVLYEWTERRCVLNTQVLLAQTRAAAVP